MNETGVRPTAGASPPEVQEGRVALLPELLVLLALHAPHPLHHLLAQLHRRRQRLGVAAQDVAEVDVKQLSWGRRWTLIRDTPPHQPLPGETK